jgi:hypothetical protein
LHLPLKINILIGIILKRKKANIKDVAVAAKLNWLIINILVKIKPAKMDFILFANVAEIARAKRRNLSLEFLLKY